MCTLVVAASTFAHHPLVVIANRDEQLGRRSEGPHVWPRGFIAPRDVEAGGSWLGLNAHGVFVGVTNRYLVPKDVTRPSRGDLVVSALGEPSARAIHEAMGRLSPGAHNGFHLIYADKSGVFATVSDGVHLTQFSLGAGVHIVTERSFGAGDESTRRARIERAWTDITTIDVSSTESSPMGRHLAERLTGLLAEHDAHDPLASTCIHLDGFDYGTKSAMVLTVGARAADITWLWAEGPPCRTTFTRIDPSPLFG